MSLPPARPRDRATAARVAILLAVAGFVLLIASGAGAATIFALADDSQVVVQGVVRDVKSYKNGAFQVFSIQPERVLVGPVTVGAPFELVQEIVFPTDRPYFERGARTLVFAVPLPPYSSYQEALPSGTYWRWTEKKKTAAELAAFADPELVEPVASYLGAHGDMRDAARVLAGLVISPSARVRGDALATLEARPALAHSVDVDALAPFDGALAREQPPIADKALVLVRLGKAGAPGVAPIAERLVARKGPLRAAALDALVSLDRVPDEATVLALSRSEDAALRIAAARGLARRPTRSSLDRIEEILKKDPSSEVQVAAIDALGGSSGERQVALIATGFHGDQAHIKAAGDALLRLATPAAIAALGETVAHGTYDAQVAAALALAGMHRREANDVLNTQLEAASDPRVRKLLEIALGRMPDEHQE